MSYNLRLNHRSGRELVDADALSRLCPNTETEVNLVEGCDGRKEVPKQMISSILRSYHDDPFSGGHDSFMRTYSKIKARFVWPNMKSDVEVYVKSCHVCQTEKFKYKVNPDILFLPEHSKVMFETIHMDFGELNKKSEIHKSTRSFLVLVDEATRLVNVQAMKESSRSVINYLDQHPYLSEIKLIITDNGSAFISNEFKNWAKRNGIRLKTTAPYHPNANGLVERKVRDLKMFYQCYPNLAYGWKETLQLGAKHLNRSYSRALGCTPFFKAFGRPSRLRADDEFCVSWIKMEKPFTDEQQEQYRVKMKQDYDRKHDRRVPEFKPGSLVLVQSGWKGKKPKVNGPFEVIKIQKRNGFVKTIFYQDDDGQQKVASIKNVQVYHRRSDDQSQSRGMSAPFVSNYLN